MKKKQSKIYLFPAAMLGITATAGMIANIPGANADDNPAIDDTINITVDSSCTMGQTVTSSHTTELNPGETNTTIGQSRIAAYCNDNEGYAIYAIGYTNGEYGNTNLVSTDGNHTIPTGISGDSSYWNMKLTQGTATGTTSYLPTMVNEFTTNTTIPDDYTKVAYRDSSTISQNQDPTASGSYFTTTYAAHVSTTQSAGIYNGQVQYVMVHPSSAPAPEKPKTINNIAYMQDFNTLSADDKAGVLRSMPYGEQYQLKDSRDQKTYYISKMRDDNIWMTQNLDLNIEAGRAYTSEDTDLIYSSIGTTWTPASSTASIESSWTYSQTIPSSHDPGDRYWNPIIYSTTGTITQRTNPSGDAHYHIGNYYNWTAAIAMNDSSAQIINQHDVNQSICPSGWRLPVYNGDKSYNNLVSAESLIAGYSGNIHRDPVYFVYGGNWDVRSGYVGMAGMYWSDMAKNLGYEFDYAYYFGFSYTGQTYTVSTTKSSGFSVRCVAR